MCALVMNKYKIKRKAVHLTAHCWTLEALHRHYAITSKRPKKKEQTTFK